MTADLAPPLQTRISALLGVDYPVIQAPMSWVARAQLAAAMSNAGGFGIVETGSRQLDEIRDEIRKMADLTDKPYGVNLPISVLRDTADPIGPFIEFIRERGVRVITTSAGRPEPLVGELKQAGFTVLHVVGTLKGALRAEAAGADALVVEGNEGGGFKQPGGASTMVLVPLVAAAVGIPVVAAGGIVDGASMAAAMCLGAEGVQMGTAMLASLESPVHDHWKQAIVEADETQTIVLNPWTKPSVRVLRNDRSQRLHDSGDHVTLREFDGSHAMYFGGDMGACVAASGQVVGRIDALRSVHEIVQDCVDGCRRSLSATLRAAMATDAAGA